MSYPLNLEKCLSLYREECEKSEISFDEKQECFVRNTVELINHAYYCGYVDGTKQIKREGGA